MTESQNSAKPGHLPINGAVDAGAKQRPTRKTPEKQQQIVDGALRAFLAHGYGVSMDAIAAEAGVAKQTLYSHFKDKRALFSALLDRLLEKFTIAGVTPHLMALEPRVFFRQIAQVAVSRMDDWQYVSLIRLVIAESARFPELADLYVQKLVKPAVDKIAEYIVASEHMRFKDPEAAARVIHGSLVYFIISQELLQCKHVMPISRDRLVESLVDLVLFAAERSCEAR